MAIPTAVALAGAGGGGGGNNIPPQGPYAYASQGRGGALVPSPGGALVAPSAQNLAYPTMVGAGQASQSNPGLFQNLLNMLGAVPGGAQALRYGPGAATAVGAFAQGDIAGGLGATAATVAAGRAMKGMAAAVPNPLVRGALQLGGGLLASNIGAQLGRGVGALGNQLVGGAQAAVGDAAGALAGTQRESGQAAFTGAEAGLSGLSDKALERQLQIAQQMGVNIPNQYLNQNYQILQKYKTADVNRQMQLNQQNAMLTGQLNQQIIAGQLAAGAQSQAGATTRDILTSNPYQASVLNTGAVRGIA